MFVATPIRELPFGVAAAVALNQANDLRLVIGPLKMGQPLSIPNGLEGLALGREALVEELPHFGLQPLGNHLLHPPVNAVIQPRALVMERCGTVWMVKGPQAAPLPKGRNGLSAGAIDAEGAYHPRRILLVNAGVGLWIYLRQLR
jgi:hypothetical protein